MENLNNLSSGRQQQSGVHSGQLLQVRVEDGGYTESAEMMVGVCRSLEQLDGDLISNLEDTVRSCVEGGNNNQMKEIRGLGDRLSGDQPQPPA